VSGEKGELYVSGLNLAQGYVRGRDPDRFLPNPLTVDPGKWCVSNGQMYWKKLYISQFAHIWMKDSDKISCLETKQNFF
jgi:hypothetical protein